MYNEFQVNAIPEHEEYIPKGICSVNPTLNSLQEIVLLHLKELSFYLLKLKEFGVTNDKIKEFFIDTMLSLISNIDYNQEQFHEIISKLDNFIGESKILYKNFCEKNNMDIESLKTYFKHSNEFSLSTAIRKGEKYFLKKTHSFTQTQKDLFDIMLFLVKSTCIKLSELQKLGKDNEEAYYAILKMLNAMNYNEFDEEQAKNEIKEFIHAYYDIVVEVFHRQVELYGNLTPTKVSFSSVPGKAILVSGSDLNKLDRILKVVEGTKIDVYTHGVDMLMAHAFPRFQSDSNLKGHFGSGIDSSLIDFAEFPGAILMTKVTLQKAEYLYRGRLFTLDPIAAPGVVKIKDYNFEPLIKSALDAKGFTTGKQKEPVLVGFNEDEVIKKIDFIIEKMLSGEIKHLYIVGLLNFPNSNKQYFMKFFELLPKDCFAISLCCPINRDNIYHPNAFYDYSLIYKILKHIKQNIPLDEAKMTIFLTKCDKHTIANLLYLKELGIKNIYMCKCPTSLINPLLMQTLQDIFVIKELSDPKIDLDTTLSQ